MTPGRSRKLDLKTSGPESEKWETPIRKEPGKWEKTPSRTAGLPNWSGISDKTRQDKTRKEKTSNPEDLTGGGLSTR